MRKQFLAAWKTVEYQGEVFEFESPAALFRLLTPKRWELLETLQAEGPCGVRELARLLGRDVRRVHDDLSVLLEAGLVEKTEEGKLIVQVDDTLAGKQAEAIEVGCVALPSVRDAGSASLSPRTPSLLVWGHVSERDAEMATEDASGRVATGGIIASVRHRHHH